MSIHTAFVYLSRHLSIPYKIRVIYIHPVLTRVLRRPSIQNHYSKSRITSSNNIYFYILSPNFLSAKKYLSPIYERCNFLFFFFMVVRTWNYLRERFRRRRWKSRSLIAGSWGSNRALSRMGHLWNASTCPGSTAWLRRGRRFRTWAPLTRISRCPSATAWSWKVTRSGTRGGHWAFRYPDAGTWGSSRTPSPGCSGSPSGRCRPSSCLAMRSNSKLLNTGGMDQRPRSSIYPIIFS